MQNLERHEKLILGSNSLSISTAAQQTEIISVRQQGFQTNPQPFAPVKAPVIEGFFPKEDFKKFMAIRKINTTLTVMLIVSLAITAVSYYFATANEIVLNDLNRQTVTLNDENSDLQNKLDKLKSFNNVDISMQQANTLKKAQQVIEVNDLSTKINQTPKANKEKSFVWAIGY